MGEMIVPSRVVREARAHRGWFHFHGRRYFLIWATPIYWW